MVPFLSVGIVLEGKSHAVRDVPHITQMQCEGGPTIGGE
jgi:hypothetical protein